MNLIEQLGGYDKAKEYLANLEKIPMHEQTEDTLYWLPDMLLQYRRQHNIFEEGDSIVFDISKPFCAKLQSDLMEVINPKYQEHDMIVRIDNQIYIVGGKSVRHATDAEIKAGKRL